VIAYTSFVIHLKKKFCPKHRQNFRNDFKELPVLPARGGRGNSFIIIIRALFRRRRVIFFLMTSAPPKTLQR
jgi:hypothetical protein